MQAPEIVRKTFFFFLNAGLLGFLVMPYRSLTLAWITFHAKLVKLNYACLISVWGGNKKQMATIASIFARILYIMKKAALYFQLGAHVCITWLIQL